MTVAEVKIRHRQYATDYLFRAAQERLNDFYQFILSDRRPLPPPLMPGVSYAAMQGLTAIFIKIPDRFPLDDIVEYLRMGVEHYYSGILPPVTAAEVEDALGRFAAMRDGDGGTKYPQLAGLA